MGGMRGRLLACRRGGRLLAGAGGPGRRRRGGHGNRAIPPGPSSRRGGKRHPSGTIAPPCSPLVTEGVAPRETRAGAGERLDDVTTRGAGDACPEHTIETQHVSGGKVGGAGALRRRDMSPRELTVQQECWSEIWLAECDWRYAWDYAWDQGPKPYPNVAGRRRQGVSQKRPEELF